MHLRNGLYRVILAALTNRNTCLWWIIKVMNGMDIFVSYQFHERNCIKCNLFLISKGNKTNFTHIIVYYICKQRVEC